MTNDVFTAINVILFNKLSMTLSVIYFLLEFLTNLVVCEYVRIPPVRDQKKLNCLINEPSLNTILGLFSNRAEHELVCKLFE